LRPDEAISGFAVAEGAGKLDRMAMDLLASTYKSRFLRTPEIRKGDEIPYLLYRFSDFP
jgi:hypothetical protein